MKKIIAIIAAVALLLALFAACGEKTGTTTPGTAAPTTTEKPAATPGSTTNAPDAEKTEAPTPEGPYNYAPGNYETDSDGFPTAPYDYPLPLTTSDEVLTYFVLCLYPNYIPESGYQDVPAQKVTDSYTGVNIEYITMTSNNGAESWAIRLASNDMPDIANKITDFVRYSGQYLVDEGFIINLYDYKEYMPNYMYYYKAFSDDEKLTSYMMPKENFMFTMYSFTDIPLWTHGYIVRGDWLDKLGLTNEDLVTMADLEETLTLFQTELGVEHPWLLTMSLDSYSIFGCYNTITALNSRRMSKPLVIGDGKVKMPYTSAEDLTWLTDLNGWFNNGIINPGIAGFLLPDSWDRYLYTNQAGLSIIQPFEIPAYEDMTDDPDVRWEPLRNPLMEEGQVTHLANQPSHYNLGNTAVSATCSNIPLAITWLDWYYCPTGSFVGSYGTEGETYVYNEDGQIRFTEFMTDRPDGMPFSYAVQFLTHNFLSEVGLEIAYKKYALENGDRYIHFHEYWTTVLCDYSMLFPAGIVLTDDQTERMNVYSSDALTYIGENYLLFVTDEKPLSEFQTFADMLISIGWLEIEAIYQEAYTDYLNDKD